MVHATSAENKFFSWVDLVVVLLKGIKSMLLNPSCHAGLVLRHRIPRN